LLQQNFLRKIFADGKKRTSRGGMKRSRQAFPGHADARRSQQGGIGAGRHFRFNKAALSPD